MKKYEKPFVRGLNDVAVVLGQAPLCTSGTFPTERCNTGGTNVGPCDALGYQAGRDCTPNGTTPDSPTTCGGGNVVTDCSNGLLASVRSPGV